MCIEPGRFVHAERKVLKEMGYNMVRSGRLKIGDK